MMAEMEYVPVGALALPVSKVSLGHSIEVSDFCDGVAFLNCVNLVFCGCLRDDAEDERSEGQPGSAGQGENLCFQRCRFRFLLSVRDSRRHLL